ncbi:hypothetical protein B0F90DRAFT_1921617 [Multifurca ochricompacta]|uniref:DUF6535 domain-containing protein n=1 Tax=Multifurca ochricompacta TaxID=376703 RepID=A0AAD4QIM4_9AGAM|nr:hypothetical protein B0F90DRAFT_1921617 [Multifurca ochricompacta]
MSQPHTAINIPNLSEGAIDTADLRYQYPPQLAQKQPIWGRSDFVDGSGPLFNMYVEMTADEDKKMAETWKADADGILVFTGLFSAAVAALIAVSIQDLKQNSQDTSAFYLTNIYQLLANANGTHISIPSTLPDPSQFSPSASAVWVNSLWFLSLAISLTCAMLATLLQQWARRYVKVTQPRYSPHKRARIRAFFAEGVDKLHLPWAVEALPTLIHLSLFLFFAGLVVFLFNVNHTVFKVVICWVGICTGKAAEESAQKLSSEIDGRALIWTLESLDEDHELEQFFASIPGFCSSSLIPEPLEAFKAPNGGAMTQALIGLMHRTLTSNLVTESVKQRRIALCTKAMNVASLPINWAIFEPVLYREWNGLLKSVEFGQFLMRISYQSTFVGYHARCVISVILASTKEYDDRWFELATDHLGITKGVLEKYIGHGDSMVLASLIDISRRTFRDYVKYGWTVGAGWRSKSLKSVSEFNTRDTVPGLQHDFCSLWNEVVLKAQNARDDRLESISIFLLRHIRHAFIDLHEGTNAAPTAFSASTADENPVLLSPSSYPLCRIDGHRHGISDSTSRIPEGIAGSTKNGLNASYPRT